MNRREAEALAAETFGAPAFACQVSNKDREKRFIVGIFGQLTGEPEPLGWGDTYEAAFAKALERGYTRESIDARRQEIAQQWQEMLAQENARACASFVNECVARAGVDTPEFRASAQQYFERRETERARQLVPNVVIEPEQVNHEPVIFTPDQMESPVISRLSWVEQMQHGLIAARKEELPPGLAKYATSPVDPQLNKMKRRTAN